LEIIVYIAKACVQYAVRCLIQLGISFTIEMTFNVTMTILGCISRPLRFLLTLSYTFCTGGQ